MGRADQARDLCEVVAPRRILDEAGSEPAWGGCGPSHGTRAASTFPAAKQIGHQPGPLFPLMLRMRVLALALSFTSSVACSAAYADQPGRPQIASISPRTALALAPERIRAPFDVTLIGEDGVAMPTYAKNGRYYVMGDASERYIIHITNPTANRVEAVVSVDGLDVIDGEAGDLGKRGYIVPPYGDLRIEGFRTSTSDVATFRFSSVEGSYAGKKGKARNVGVIAVALFEEQAGPEIVEPPVAIGGDYGRDRGYDYEDDLAPAPPRAPYTGGPRADASRAPVYRPGPAKGKRAPAAEDRAAESEVAPSGGAVASRPAPYPMPSPAPMPPPPPSKDEGARCCDSAPQEQQRRERVGLGTEYGEQRYSAASYTRFVRAAGKPIAIAELRYNDRAGLAALGIAVAPAPDENEVMLRETADPFPGDRFARPPTP
jgi:hypothetical protein